jgi:hypothetical protein
VLERILDRLAELIVTKLVDHTDEIAAAVAREVMAAIMPKLPDLSDLDDQLLSKIPDVGALANQIVSQIVSRIPFLGGR